jgi:16S rRNA processing protein RimM
MAVDGSNPAWPPDAVEVGLVLGAWGVKGALKVKPHTAVPEALVAARHWFLRPGDARPGRNGAAALPPVLTVRRPRVQNDVVIASAAEVPDRNAAESLIGARIYVSRRDFPAPAAGEYYWVDLIGLLVVNRDRAELGRVVDLIDTGPHCVLRVVAGGEGGEPAVERLIPFVDAYVDEVDPAGGRIAVDWGLDY